MSWHIPPHWLHAMQALGTLAAHRHCTRQDWEQMAQACAAHIPPAERGATVDFLLWVAEQFQRLEEDNMAAERGRVRRQLWPLAATQAPLAELLARAQEAAGDTLTPTEINLLVDEVLVSSEGRWRSDAS